jgi:IPT/TIG domain
MFRFPWSRLVNRALHALRTASPRPRGLRLHCEELEPRWQPAAFNFSTGLPDGKVATISEPPNAHNSKVEFESADDFNLTTETRINHASFTGLLTGGATLKDVQNVFLTIYRVFPNDSNVGRTSGPPTFSTPQVPTRVNSPADNEIDNFDSAVGDLRFNSRVLSTSFTAMNSVSSADKISLNSKGNGSATGQEVEFDVTFKTPLDLPAGHYFFVPKVGLSDKAAAGADFLWLSAPKPIVPPGTPPPAGTTDLQSWMRFDPGLAPDWLRIGTDIIGGAAFNGSFSLSGDTVPPQITSLSQNSVGEGSPDLTITLNGSNFTSQSTVLVNGLQPLTTRFVSANQLQAIVPASLLAEEGHLKISVQDAQSGSSNNQEFTVTDSVPVLTASVTQGTTFQQITLNGMVTDQATEGHRVRINWGDGHKQELDLGVNSSSPFTVSHNFARHKHLHHRTIQVTAVDDEGVASAPMRFDVIV